MKKILILAVMVLIAACDPTPSADTLQKKRVEQQMREAERAVPPPRIGNFTMLRDAVRIQELADDAISTWAYYMDYTGGLHFLCEAKGYGLPYSTQTTNPQKKGHYHDSATLPQAEPSGLYMPDNVAATWVLCVNDNGEFDAVYWEPDLIVSPFPLKYTTSLREE